MNALMRTSSVGLDNASDAKVLSHVRLLNTSEQNHSGNWMNLKRALFRSIDVPRGKPNITFANFYQRISQRLHQPR
jgi:hypothetical protein